MLKMNAPVYFLVMVGAMLVIAGWVHGKARAGRIRKLAALHGFRYLGSSLPQLLSLSNLPPGLTAIENVIDGECRGRHVVALDCRFGEGKGSWRRTVIAVHADKTQIAVASFDRRVETNQSGDWTLIYRARDLAFISQQLTPIAELSAYLDSI
jgi:hypothetical protein